ncbi:MAG TPA: HK97 family phage prohead protease [Afipia sp.]
MNKVELGAGLEVRFAPDDSGTFSGYASVWQKRDAYGDTIERGAFAKSLADHAAAGSQVLMLRGHDINDVIGVWDSLAEDDVGLKASGRLVLETRSGAETHALMKAHAISGLSIGFHPVRTSKQTKGRLVHEINLVEISVVPRPAQHLARIHAVREQGHPKPFERLAQDIRDLTSKLKV